MITIYKYQLTDAETTLQVPDATQWLHVDEQSDRVTVWAQVFTDQPLVDRTLHIVGTGLPVPDGAHRHIGSCKIGPFVFHVFEGVPS